MADLFNVLNTSGISSKYILRSSGDEVEVVAFNLVENGARNDGDWVSYIDTNGSEYIKEHLNIQFDFKAAESISNFYEKMLSLADYKAPSPENARLYEVTRELVVKREMPVNSAIEIAKRVIEVTNEEKE